MWHWLNRNLLSTQSFYHSSRTLLPWVGFLLMILFVYGCINGLFIAPPDYQQGDGYRIIFVHVPSALTAMLIYAIMAVCAFLTLVWRIKVAAHCMIVSAPIGAWLTALALITGAIWGKPMWGTWWIWDARLTSVLILFFLYLGFMALHGTIANRQNSERACSIIALTGAINLPIIHYSVIWWNTLHQGPTISKFSAPSMDSAMLYPLYAMILAFILFYFFVLLIRMRTRILLHETRSTWVGEVI